MDSGVRYVASADGTRVAYRAIGTGRPLLWLMDQFGSHTRLYRDQPGVQPFLERLGRGRQIIWIDLRGTGMSDRGCSDYSPDALVQDVLSVVDDAGVTSCDVLANGGRHAVAVRLAATRPALIGRMIFGSPFALPPDASLANFMETNWDLFRELAIQRSTHRPLHEVRHVLAFSARCVDQRDFLAARRASEPART